jgi:hypothetical protein
VTAWSPIWRVKINGTSVTNVTLSNLTITSGRTDIYSQPVASYCSVTLINTDESTVNFDINESLTVEVKDNSNNWVQIFGGTITDLDIEVGASGVIAIRENIRIIALGALARLPKATFQGNLASGLDGEQIAYVLNGLLYNSWNEVPASLDWGNYDPTITWANAENSGVGTIDTGDYELDSQNGLVTDAYSLVTTLANSGLGYVYEDNQGRISYADSTHRSTYLSTNGYDQLDANHAFSSGIRTSKRSGDVRNSITISYTSSGNQEVTDEDADSIALYGQLSENIRTYLKNQTDAEQQAAFYLSIRAYPQYIFKNITFPLGNPEISSADRLKLLNVFIGQPIDLINLPSNIGAGTFQGFVEGWTFQASVNGLSITLNLSPVAYSLQAFDWDDVPATETWNTLNPTLEWLNATIVA